MILSQRLRLVGPIDAAIDALAKADAIEDGRADVLAERAEVELARGGASVAG